MTPRDRQHVLGLCARPEGYDCWSMSMKHSVRLLAKEGLIKLKGKTWRLTAAGMAAYNG